MNYDGIIRLAKDRYGNAYTNDVEQRINYEWSKIAGREGWSDYVQTVYEITTAIREGGGLLGPGYGSAVSSAVFYTIGATDVDPIANSLIFERYIGGRVAVPMPVAFIVDTKGYQAARNFIAKKYNSVKILPWDGVGPQGVMVDGFEINFVLSLSLDRLASVLQLLSMGNTLNWIPLKDGATFSLFNNGETEDVVGFEKDNVRQALRNLHHVVDEDLNAIPLLARRNLNELNRYVSCANGETPIKVKHDNAIHFLGETAGIILFQEQLMNLAEQMASFDARRAGHFAKIVSRGIDLRLSEAHDEWIAGAIHCDDFSIGDLTNKNAALACAEAMWDDIVTQGKHAGQKCHAVAMARLGYIAAYLKTHFRDEWKSTKL